MLYTVKTVRGKLLPEWIEESIRDIDRSLGEHTEEELVKQGIAKRVGIELKVDIVKVKLVEIKGG